MLRRLIAFACAFVLFASTANAEVKHVIQISVDGLSARLLQQYLSESPEDFCTFRRFIDEGATTLNARTDCTHTITLPNHTCMLTARPVLQPKGQSQEVHHNYTANSDPKVGDTLQSSNRAANYIASVFDVVHDHGKTTGFYASKSKFSLYTSSWDDNNGAQDEIGEDNGQNKVDHFCLVESPRKVGEKKLPSSAKMHKQLLTDLAKYHMAYSFVHYRDPDTCGHTFGWGTADYCDAIRMVDVQLGELVAMIENDCQFKNKTAIILSADHGGLPGTKGHHKIDESYNYTIPFLVWGADVSHGDLYRLSSASRANPGVLQTDYNAPKQPIRNGDAANLSLTLLGLPAIPGSTINAAQDLAVK